MEQIQITPEQKKLVLGYKEEAMSELSNKEAAASAYKDIVAATSETTNIPKKILSKYFMTCFRDQVAQLTDEAAVIEFLDS